MNTSLTNYIGIEQSNALYRQMPALWATTLSVVVLTVGVLSQHFPLFQLLLWAMSVLLFIFFHWLSIRKFTPETTNKSNYKKRLKVFTFWFVLSGFNCGVILIIFHDPNLLIYTLYLVCVLTAYVSVSLTATSLYLPAFFGFCVPSVTCVALPLAFEGVSIYLWIVLSMPVYVVVMIFFARVTERNFKLAKSVEFENQSLLIQVTEEKNRAQEEKNRAQKAVNDKNKFLAAISHDLRQPLHAMNLYIEALEPRLSDSLDKNILDKMSMSGSALNDLLHGLLDISRLDANAVENRPQHLELSRIANELKNEFLPQVKQQELELILDIDEQHIVYADPVLLERILRNLLGNAVKFTEKGTVILSSTVVESTIKVTITDTGIGIAEDKIDDIFSEFTQIGNPERDRNKGVGLGLSIVKRMCELQDIDLSFESTVGHGTQVSLELKQGDLALLPLISKSEGHGFESLTILFVDDEETILEGMEMIIKSWKCHPLIADNGKAALKLVRELDVNLDLVISDLRLRDEESGVTVIEAIREELNEDIPAIVVTGDTAVDRIELVKNSNAALMHKPLKTAELRQQIESLLNNSLT